MTWWRINGRLFVAALAVEAGTVAEAAPILGWAVGKPWPEVKARLRKCEWSGAPLPEPPNEAERTCAAVARCNRNGAVTSSILH